jgi:hypothetical protein
MGRIRSWGWKEEEGGRETERWETEREGGGREGTGLAAK